MSSFRAASPSVPASPVADADIAEVVAAISERYGIENHPVYVKEMGGVRGGLGNAIPIPLPLRRIYVVRFHRCMRHADALALRGLFAHELMHVLQYSRASYLDLLRFMARYATFSATATRRRPIGYDWVQQFEHLTDLMAVKYGEGTSIAAWKRFKAEATERGLIKDSWDHLYLRDTDIDSLTDKCHELEARIRDCVVSLDAVGSLQPFARRAR